MRRVALSMIALLVLLSFALFACIPSRGQQEVDSRQQTAVKPQSPTPARREPLSTVGFPSPPPTLPAPSVTPAPQPARTQAATSAFPPHGLADSIDSVIAQSGGRWHIIIQPLDGGEPLYVRGPERRITIASVVKVPLAMLFFAALEENGIPEADLPAYLQSTGVGGRTFDQLLRAMLVVSEEKATAILEDYTRRTLNLPAQQRAWGWEHLDLEARRDTAAGVADIFAQLYRGEHISPTARALILGYLSDYTPNDDTRIGVLRPQLPPGAQIYNKRGSLLTPYVVADVAIIENPSGTDYLLVIFAYNGEPRTTYERLDAAVAEIAQAFWDFVAKR